MDHIAAALWTLFLVTIAFICLVILFEKRNPSKTVAWLLVLSLLPIVGFLLYMLFGRTWRKEKWGRDRPFIDSIIKSQTDSAQGALNKLKEIEHPVAERLAQLISDTSSTLLTTNNEVSLFFDGKSLYRSMFQTILTAKEFIHISFFIIRNDPIGYTLKDLLIQKAREGVQVRLIYDAVGSSKLSKAFCSELREAGVSVKAFLPLNFPIFHQRWNYRNHRKIVIIDGTIGYLGGFNIGTEYLGLNPRLGPWRDTHVLLQGESVSSLQLIFLTDWYLVGREKITDPTFLPTWKANGSSTGVKIQLVSSGPDTPWPSILHTYFSLITNAKSSIWITTPYLIPDEAILIALKTAALSGVDVKIILPHNPDHYFVYYATHSYVEELLEAGIQVYLYTHGFIHAKTMICDHSISSIGTANMDMRSFFLNFEVNAIFYDEEITYQLRDQFLLDLEQSIPLDLKTYRQKPWYRNFIESFARLFSPLM